MAVDVERQVSTMQNVIDMVRTLRDMQGVGLKYPRRCAVVVSKHTSILEDVQALSQHIREEVNVREVRVAPSMPCFSIAFR